MDTTTKWVKPRTLYSLMDVSASTILKMIREGTLIEGKHYKVFPFGRRFNFLEMELLTSDERIEDLIDDLLQ